MSRIVYLGKAARTRQPLPPDPGPTPTTYNPTTLDAGVDAAMAQMWGGESDVKGTTGEAQTRSWANNPMPDDVARDTANEAQARADFLSSIYTIAPGTDPNDTTIYPTGGGPSWGPLVSWPTLNINKYTSVFSFVDSSAVPWKRVECVDGLRRTASWHMTTNAMMWSGIPLPDGLQPTNDSDGTLEVWDLSRVWAGDPTNTNYHGWGWFLWGAKSPEQNIAEGNISPTTGLPQTGWTAKSAGRITGAKTRLTARQYTRTSGDAGSQALASMGAPAAPWDPALATDPAKTYWGYGQDGVAESNQWGVSAAHIPMTHTVLTMRDIQNGVARHPWGFALFTMYPAALRNKGFVWPATGYDSASRPYLKHGHRFRFPAGSTPVYPAGMPTEWRFLFDICFYMIRDYGAMLVDTTGASFSFRAEPGVASMLPAGFSAKQFIQYLFQDVQNGTRELHLVMPGTDAEFYPAPPPPASTLPTLPEPAPGTVLASGGDIKTTLAGLNPGETLYLAAGGTYTLTSVTTITTAGVKIATQPGGPNATITGDFQFRIYADNVELWRINFNQGYVAGKQIEVSGSGCAMVDCDFTNNFNVAAPSSTNSGAMILFTTDGPSGVCTNFLMYGCHFHQIGKVGSGFDHALYLKELNGGTFHSNTAYQIHGGWFFHGYPNTKNLTITKNFLESGCFVTLWQDVAGAVTGNSVTKNAWHNAFTGLAKPPVQGNTGATQGNVYDRNAGLQEFTAQGGSSGLDTTYTVSNNLVADPQFANPAAGDFTIGNAAVASHIA